MLIQSIEKPLRYKNANGQKGIVTKEYIEVNGDKHGIIIESLNKGNPLLVIMHGGPGFPLYPIAKANDLQLVKFFDVCYWDQRGTGMAYQTTKTKNSVTMEQLIDDTIEVIHYLREKYSQEKVYLFCHSWGTILGSLVANRHPELFHAYIGVGQVGSVRESEQEIYNFMMRAAKSKKDRIAIKEIEKVSFDKKYYENRTYGAIRSKYTKKYNGGFTRNGYSNLKILKDVLFCPHYTLKEKVNIFRGSYSTYQSLAPSITTIDLIKLAPAIHVPVFIFQGIHDYQTTHTQAKRFYDFIQSPRKKMFVFYNSAHSPFIEEKELFLKIIEEQVLTNT